MQIGRVIGTVVATRKDERLTQPLNLDLSSKGDSLIAVDTVGAGIGELVLYVRGTAGRIAANKLDAPIDASIVGIIDNMDVREDKL